MDKQTFCSSQSTSNTARYAAALYRQGTRAGPPWLLEASGGREAGWGLGIPAGAWQVVEMDRLWELEFATAEDFWLLMLPDLTGMGRPRPLSSWDTDIHTPELPR